MASGVSDRKKEILRTAAIFSGLGEDELEVFAAESALRSYRTGQNVFRKNDPGDSLYVVASGTVHVVEDDGPSLIAELLTGDTFGELEFFTSTRRNARAFAVQPVQLLAFPRAGLRLSSLLRKWPQASARLLHGFLTTVAGRIREANTLIKENSPWIQDLRRRVYGDKLSGLFNKTYLEENLPLLLSQCVGSLGLLMFKPDNFKAINDDFGHGAGDRVIGLLALELKRLSVAPEVAARYMGNELVLVVPGASRPVLAERAQTVRRRMKALDLSEITGSSDLRLTVSVGAALYPEHGGDSAALIAAAHELPLLGRERGGDLVLFPEDRDLL